MKKKPDKKSLNIPYLLKKTPRLGILAYSLPEEQESLDDALSGWKYRLVLTELQWGFLRNKVKYSNESEEKLTAYEEIRNEISRLCEEHGIDLY